MANWTYRCYDDGKEKNLWDRWYSEKTESVKAAHDVAFDILEQLENWQRPLYGKMNNMDGIGEVRFKEGVQYRVFGYPTKGVRQEFVILGIGSKKDDVYSPKNILKTVVKRKKAISNGTAKTVSCNRPEEDEEIPD